MEIEQKRGLNRTRFTFNDDHLTYTQGQPGGMRTFEVNYSDIPLENWDLEERATWFLNAGIVLLVVWFCQVLLGVIIPPATGGFFLHWPLAAACCMGLYHVTIIRYTVFQTDAGKICLICDNKHEEVINEILTRRRAQLLSWYGEIDYANDPGEEIRKFHWLKLQGAIGEEEFESIRSRIEIFHGPIHHADTMEGPSIN